MYYTCNRIIWLFIILLNIIVFQFLIILDFQRKEVESFEQLSNILRFRTSKMNLNE